MALDNGTRERCLHWNTYPADYGRYCSTCGAYLTVTFKPRFWESTK